MSEGQRAIKYVALAFAIFLSVNIILAIVGGMFLGIKTFGLLSNETIISDNQENRQIEYSQEYSDIKKLDIDCNYSSFKILTSSNEKIKVEINNNQKVTVNKENDTLKVKEDTTFFDIFDFDKDIEIRLYIPENQKFEDVNINTGAGKVEISKLTANTLKLSLGAGESKISNLTIEDTTKISGGVGKTTIDNSVLSNLKTSLGVGEVNLSAKILGDSKISSGVGQLNLDLKGSKEDYEIKASHGLGSFTIDNKEIKDDSTYGDGINYIKVSGGVGKVDIKFNK